MRDLVVWWLLLPNPAGLDLSPAQRWCLDHMPARCQGWVWEMACEGGLAYHAEADGPVYGSFADRMNLARRRATAWQRGGGK